MFFNEKENSKGRSSLESQKSRGKCVIIFRCSSGDATLSGWIFDTEGNLNKDFRGIEILLKFKSELDTPFYASISLRVFTMVHKALTV